MPRANVSHDSPSYLLVRSCNNPSVSSMFAFFISSFFSRLVATPSARCSFSPNIVSIPTLDLTLKVKHESKHCNQRLNIEDSKSLAVNMDLKKCGMFSSFRWLSPDIYHINILRNLNEVDVHWGRSAKTKKTYF